MARSKLNLENTALVWDANRRYKVNSIVFHINKTYQNLTGKNSEPGVGLDWFIPETNSGFPKIQFTADGIQDNFDLTTTILAKAVFWNGALLNDDDWEQTGTTFTLTFTPASGDIIKPI